MEIRKYLIALAIKYEGQWEQIYKAMFLKEEISDLEIEMYLKYLKCNVLTILDESYPDYLKQIIRPPFVLFYYGDISLISNYENNVAIVGSRDASSKGLKNVYEISKTVSSKYNIVSGLARGIDAAAHLGAIDGGGKTIAVLGCGIEECYPTCNQDLYNEIKQNHLLISEYYNYIPPYSRNFPHRNRLIVGFSKGVLLGEAKPQSGSQITAHMALEMGRTLMSIPSNELNNSLCNLCIREGCPVVLEADDVYDYLE